MIHKFKKEFIETEVGKIIYYIRGDGPPVLLLHGYPQYSLMWEETALLLSDKYTTIIPDLRGYGESAKPKGLFDHSNYSKREMAKDMIQIMDNLKYHQLLWDGICDAFLPSSRSRWYPAVALIFALG